MLPPGSDSQIIRKANKIGVKKRAEGIKIS
jgi:hypothetical protein